ncbi:type II toxin-antitoxin system VapC family toxin [Parapedobacter koreensis]|uniref:PIN domain nuclease, a component of toxin-antitoxin system (PIN domain) n=1 Tax=Parapedobacter koreensis TaxID=332977 RepID=A0A1H7IP26_9SPHI|nr:type II toxin-antitoxin system VapC family toxin [Parapedobacter koreensis]SEK64229.1 PIN domain nuclease, a component of toxin-antitoxin system (PIN domain) [Parapedobacter koreensis]
MGQYLLDTHTLLWLHDDSPRLSKPAKSIILDSTNDLHVSIASFWEITIKKSLGKLAVTYSLNELYEACITSGIIILPIQLSNLIKLEGLGFYHKDPFDRLIAAAAIDADMTVISLDPNIAKYPLKTIW